MEDEMLEFTVDVVEYPEEKTFVGECLDIPIVVEGENYEQIREKTIIAIKGYFKAFPEMKGKIFPKRTILTVPIPP